MASPVLPFKLVLVEKGQREGTVLSFSTDDQVRAVTIAEGYLLTSPEQAEVRLTDQEGAWLGTVALSYRSPWL